MLQIAGIFVSLKAAISSCEYSKCFKKCISFSEVKRYFLVCRVGKADQENKAN